ncbi:hypothetical protein L2E82_01573 [Cichorium intybus]|uniref:Uncharacterized protein n=1 Tax=Cichorium intybus TaxID=13427 RepID=A0ACB9H0T9_CICIN|nr:hypothetical protein L2E82_01573 [Cichorium intybus]
MKTDSPGKEPQKPTTDYLLSLFPLSLFSLSLFVLYKRSLVGETTPRVAMVVAVYGGDSIDEEGERNAGVISDGRRFVSSISIPGRSFLFVWSSGVPLIYRK